jgi:chromosome segregation ATPase
MLKDRLTDEQLRQLCRETKEAQNPLGQMAGKLAAELLTARAEIVAARDAARAAQDANGEAGNTITQLQAEKHELQDDYIALTAERDELKAWQTRAREAMRWIQSEFGYTLPANANDRLRDLAEEG